MRDNMREQLNKEMTRKQFLQYLAGALLMIFGFNNLMTLLLGNKSQRILLQPETDRSGFGSRKFGA